MKRNETTKEERDACDAVVLAAMQAGAERASAIERATGLDMRTVDRTLQRLRRKGAIKLIGGARWSVL